MTMKTIHNFIMLWFVFCYNNRLGESIKFQRLNEQPFFRWGHIIGVVIVSRDSVLFDPQYAVDGLIVKRAIFMQCLAKGINGVNLVLFRK